MKKRKSWYMHSAWLVLFFAMPINALFDYDRAVYAAQHNDWEKAQQLLMPLITHTSEDPQLLYDAGVTAYKQEQFKQAQAYFAQAANSKQATKELKEAAFFNEGNAHVKLNQLHDAITRYENVLASDSTHERAKHNIEIVKKMLEEKNKKQEKSEQPEQQNNDDENKEKHNNQQSHDQSSESHQDSQKKDEKKDRPEKNNDQKKSEGDNNQSNDKQQSDSQESDQKNDEHGQEKEDMNTKAPDDTSEHQAKQEKQEKSERNSKQEQHEKGQHNDQKVEQWIAHMLQEQEQQDAKANKKIIKATVGKPVAGQDGYNCW